MYSLLRLAAADCGVIVLDLPVMLICFPFAPKLFCEGKSSLASFSSFLGYVGLSSTIVCPLVVGSSLL